jgi:3-hydroxyisobutyrate dehydrogenase-like beta-hydroxyacid dehydrogenase
MKNRIGFIGLGQMGKWMAINLLRAGFDLTVFDIDHQASALLQTKGASVADSPAKLSAQTEWLILCLPDPEVIDTVIWGKDGAVEGLSSGQLIIDCGTSDYRWTAEFAAKLSEKGIRFVEFAAKLSEKGIRFVDAPVTGMENRAKMATLTIMFGGPKRIFDQIRPVLEAMGNQIVFMGGIGCGQLAKLVNQLLFNVSIAAMAEVLPMATKLGLDPEKISKVINSGSGRSFASEVFIPNILENRFDQGYSLIKAYKDMTCASRISADHQIPLPVVKAATATYQMALESGLGNQDKGAMIKVFEQLLDLKFRKKAFL